MGPFPLPEGEGDLGQDAIDVLHHIVVPEALHAITFGFDETRTARIIFNCFGMLSAIHLDHQPFGKAKQINAVRPNRRLESPLPLGEGLAQ